MTQVKNVLYNITVAARIAGRIFYKSSFMYMELSMGLLL